MAEWTTANRLSESNYGRLMVNSTDELPSHNLKTGQWNKGHKTWNKGMTWKQMGIHPMTQKRLKKALAKGREYQLKASMANAKKHRIPILATRISDGQEMYFECCRSFAERFNVNVRNVNRAMNHGYTCKGFKIKRFDDYE